MNKLTKPSSQTVLGMSVFLVAEVSGRIGSQESRKSGCNTSTFADPNLAPGKQLADIAGLAKVARART
ncbi:hypothetical protein [Burkholderia contaminans]|uniref:hypothetical protein n=1 Tax=Burkholderia contaminans TaxID=488447 RepID=UPI001F147E34|nr:hypothetical protein [Burkholderia contaminans]UMY33578.1 hypothetical protein MMB18_38580 [Burkholderia contaminans]